MPPFVEIHIPNYNQDRVPDTQIPDTQVNVADMGSVEFTFILVRRDTGKMSLQINVLFETKKVLKYRVAKEIIKRLSKK